MTGHNIFMQRALDLAKLGLGFVRDNPMVGAVLVHDHRIIGEGYHAQWGGPHAEVNCLESVKASDRHLIPESTLYVTLEPCSHTGKTPPCADRIIQENIGRVVVGALDPSKKVNGRGILRLKEAGVAVTTGVLEIPCRQVSRHFFHMHEKHRPFIMLKWAESSDGYIGIMGEGNTRISGEATQRYTHHLRSTHMAIMVGYRTALLDNPALTVRYANGLNPLRLVVDPSLSLPRDLRLFTDGQLTWVLHDETALTLPEVPPSVKHIAVPGHGKDVGAMMDELYRQGVQSILVEGGAALLQQFIYEGYFDEAVQIVAKDKVLGNGISSPALRGARLLEEFTLAEDIIRRYERTN